jgi:hypothetical protein
MISVDSFWKGDRNGSRGVGMGGDRGRRIVESTQGHRKQVGKFGVDDYCREYYDLYGLDWDLIKEGTRWSFVNGITWCKIYAWAFLATGIGLATLAWYSRPIPSFHLHFLEFEWLMTFLGLFFALAGWVHFRGEAHWREAVVRRYAKPFSPPEPGLERAGVSEPSYF